MEPMIMIPEGKPGAGGYREHDILVIGKDSANNITKFPIPFHAQEKLLVLIIVVEMTSNFRQEIRYSYYRNDPVKYDLNVFFVFYISHSFPIF